MTWGRAGFSMVREKRFAHDKRIIPPIIELKKNYTNRFVRKETIHYERISTDKYV